MIAERAKLMYRSRTNFARTTACLCVIGMLTLVVGSAGALSATDRAAAQALFDDAKKMMREGNYGEACPALEESQRIEARSGTLLNLADCYEHQGRLASAWATFVDAAAMAAATGNKEREQGARDRAASLAPRISKLIISLAPGANIEGIEVTRDGDAVGRPQFGVALPADSGPHVLTAQAPARKPWRVTVLVEAGATTTTVIVPELAPVVEDAPPVAVPEVLPPAEQSAARPSSAAQSLATPLPTRNSPAVHPAPVAPLTGRPDRINESPRPSHAGVITGAIVTGLFAAGSVVTGLVYKSKRDEFNSANAARADNRSSLHSVTNALGIANLALLGATAVSAGVTVILWASGPSKADTASLELRTAVGAGLTGITIGYHQ